MKKYFYFVACFITACFCFSLLSCSNENDMGRDDPQDDIKFIFGTWTRPCSDGIEYWTFSKDATGHTYLVYMNGQKIRYRLGKDDYSWYIDETNRIQCRMSAGNDQGILIRGNNLYFDDEIKMKKVSNSTTVPVRASDAIKP